MKNKERRKEPGKVFFDVVKYLLITIAIGSLFTKDVNIISGFLAIIFSVGILFLAYFITPLDSEE